MMNSDLLITATGKKNIFIESVSVTMLSQGSGTLEAANSMIEILRKD